MPGARRSFLATAFCAGTFLGLTDGTASAADIAPAPPPASWWDTLTVSGHAESGITLNPDYPGDGLNFGHLFTDKANTPLFNQLFLTVQRPIDPTSPEFDFGFKAQLMYGSDARYTHYLGEFNYIINDRSQFTPVDLYAIAHLPWVFPGGIDIKAGQYTTLLSAEGIDATSTYLYTHSYIFNFAVPLVHTGIMTISHIDPMIDIYAGVDTGVNTTFGDRVGDNNAAIAFLGGIGLNLLDGNLTILATTHIGPENPNTPAVAAACFCNPNRELRYLNTIVTTWKATESLTFITDINYSRDDAFFASAYGVAQYVIFAVNDWLKLVGRAEVWRDNNNFFIAAFPGNFDFVNFQMGFPSTTFFGPAPTTYFEVTGGLNITPVLPEGLPVIKSLIVRPEIRYDASLNGTLPFNGVGFGGRGFPGFGVGTKNSQFTFGGDIIAKF